MKADANDVLASLRPNQINLLRRSNMATSNLSAFNLSRKTTPQNFWPKAILTANPDKCWNWRKPKKSNGYGYCFYQGKNWRAHRLAWLFTYNRKPKGLILHSCDNRACVNPVHLREGTYKDNAQDKVDRDRQAKGEGHGNAKLNNKIVRSIRQMFTNGLSRSEIARNLKVGRYSVNRVCSRKSWTHVQ